MKVTIDDRTGNGTLIKIGLGFVMRKAERLQTSGQTTGFVLIR